MAQTRRRIQKTIKNTAKFLGIEINRVDKDKYLLPEFPVEFSTAEIEILKYVLDKKITQLSLPRLIATVNACKYAIENDIDGDFVECGVWRGGNALVMAELIKLYQSPKKVWMYDTFTGMTFPTKRDKDFLGNDAVQMYQKHQRVGFNESLGGPASLEEVKQNFKDKNLFGNNLNFICGDVKETLSAEKNLPRSISVLRLDTDWYASTILELETLYPRLTVEGTLLIDDYGHWQGSRAAVDQYFINYPPKPLLWFSDYTGRAGIKLN
jgi:hypothetical protein